MLFRFLMNKDVGGWREIYYFEIYKKLKEFNDSLFLGEVGFFIG